MKKIFSAAVVLAVAAVCIGMVSFSFAAEKVEKEKGLVAYWNFDEGKGDVTADVSGNKNDGTLTNEPEWVKGVKGNALSFEGEQDCVAIEPSDKLDFGQEGTSYTVAFWINSSTPPENSDSHFITQWGEKYPFSIVCYPQGSVEMRTYDGTKDSKVAGGAVFDGKWHYVVCERDGENKKIILYIDGKKKGSVKDKTEGDLNVGAPVNIGFGAGADFSGKLDEIKMYNRLLTKEEIVAYYESVIPAK